MGLVTCFCIFFIVALVDSTLLDCTNQIYCKGPLIEHVAKSKIITDFKSFVDLTLTKSENETVNDFNQLLKSTNNNPSKQDISDFLDKYFISTEELESYTPPDFNPNPKFLNKIKNETLKEFSKNIVKIWPTLARKIKEEVKNEPEKHSLIPLPNGFIVPGGRFKEIYYWDSYWVVEGLLISEMYETVKGILENFSSLIQKYGFIPNGSRIYYLGRSQPPLFTLMVYSYVSVTKDINFLKDHIDIIDKEVMYWLDEKTVRVNKNGESYTLAHFVSGNSDPRPESYAEDLETCSIFPTEEARGKCYNNLNTGAESGWDFSARWFITKTGDNKGTLADIQTTRLIQVDLNAILCRNFKILKQMYQFVGKPLRAKFWEGKEELWKTAIEEVLFDKKDGIWYDYDIELNRPRKYFYPTNISPLALEILDPEVAKIRGDAAVKYLKDNGVDTYPGGIPSSLDKETGQQWDFPNAWAPLQDGVISALQKSGSEKGLELAKNLAKKWIDSMVIGYKKNQQMFEKYDATKAGERGSGGEYQTQTGFGWTNGAALKLIYTFLLEAEVV